MSITVGVCELSGDRFWDVSAGDGSGVRFAVRSYSRSALRLTGGAATFCPSGTHAPINLAVEMIVREDGVPSLLSLAAGFAFGAPAELDADLLAVVRGDLLAAASRLLAGSGDLAGILPSALSAA